MYIVGPCAGWFMAESQKSFVFHYHDMHEDRKDLCFMSFYYFINILKFFLVTRCRCSRFSAAIGTRACCTDRCIERRRDVFLHRLWSRVCGKILAHRTTIVRIKFFTATWAHGLVRLHPPRLSIKKKNNPHIASSCPISTEISRYRQTLIWRFCYILPTTEVSIYMLQ